VTNESWFQLEIEKSIYWQKNHACFRLRYPDQAAIVSNGETKLAEYQFLQTGPQQYACRVKTDEKEWDIYPPASFPRMLQQSFDNAVRFLHRGASFLILAGSGLGYLAFHLEEKIRGDMTKGLLLLENRPELILAQLCLFDCEQLLTSQQLFWAISKNPQSVLETVFQQEGLFRLEDNRLVTIPERSLTAEERRFYLQLPPWFSSAKKSYSQQYQERKNAFNQSMAAAPNLQNGCIWSIATPEAYAHTPLLRSLMSGFEQIGWTKRLLELKDGFSVRFRMEDDLLDARPDAILVCNSASEFYVSRGVKRPRICWFLDDPRHYNLESFGERFCEQDHIFYIDRTYAAILAQTAAGSHHFLPATASLAKTGVYRKELAAPILFVGAYDCVDAYLQEFSLPEKEEIMALLESLIRQAGKSARQIAEELPVREETLFVISKKSKDYTQTMRRSFSSDVQRMEYFLYNLANSYKREQYVRALLDKGIVVYGPDRWRPVFGEKYGNQFKGWMPPEHLADAYASADICLNIHSLQCPTCFNPRDFDVLSAQGCLLSDHVADMETGILKPGQDLISFRDKEQLIREVETLLHDHKRREEFKRAGFETYKNRHTPAHRAREINNHLLLT
jgi:hypothetical protein